jgi:hypothetical protein
MQKVIQKQRQRTLREILPKRLRLVLREWDNANGTTGRSYRARVWHHKRQKYHFISLKALTEVDAIGEALETYAQLTAAIEKNLPITTHAKKLEHYIGLFMEHMEVRKKNGKITPKRVIIVRQLLRSLERFYGEQNAPSISELPHIYEANYETWRDLSLTRLTSKPLTPSSRNNEYNCHRQFFGFLRDQEIISKVPEVNLLKVTRTNRPFPKERYNKLMRKNS